MLALQQCMVGYRCQTMEGREEENRDKKKSVGGETNCGAENQEGQIKGRRRTKGRTKEGSVEDAEGSREAEAAEHCLPFTTRL